jgi:hypothetical protein
MNNIVFLRGLGCSCKPYAGEAKKPCDKLKASLKGKKIRRPQNGQFDYSLLQ